MGFTRYSEHPQLKRELHFFPEPQYLELHLNPNLRLKQLDWKNCNLCNFTVRNTKADSTERDVIIGTGINAVENVILFVRTLRTTGSKAHCVILLDHIAYSKVPKSTFEYAEECGGQIINVGDLKSKGIGHSQNLVYVVCYEFVYLNQDQIDRVIISDLYDSVFQGDPFNSQVGGSYLNVIDEGSDFRSWTGGVNKGWVEKFNFKLNSDQLKEKYVCTGYIGGTLDVMMKFFTLFNENFNSSRGTTDQGEVNYIYFSGKFKKNGVHVPRNRRNELIRHTACKPLKQYELMGEVRSINNEEVYASVVHHYYANHLFKYSLLRVCPIGNADKSFYISHCNSTCVEKMLKEI